MPFRSRSARSHRARPLRSWLIGAALLALGGSVTGVAPAGHADEVAVPQAGQDEVFAELGLDDVPADYVVLVDTSASMQDNNRYAGVRSSLRSFFESLRPIDRVTLITFDALPSVIQRGAPGSAVAALDRMPDTPLGTSTDIGAALEEAVRQLESPDAARAGAVVLFTDAVQQPSATSRYSSPQAWSALAARAAALADHLRGYAIPLGSGESGGVPLQTVLPGTVVLRLPADQLQVYLSQVPRELRETLAVSRVKDDLTGGVEVSWRQPVTALELSDDAAITVDLRATTGAVPIEIVDLQATLTGIDATVTGLPEHLALPAGGSQPVTLRVQANAGPGLHWGRTTRAVNAELRITGRVDSPWRTVITDDFGQRLALRSLEGATPVSGTVESGLGWSTAAVCSALVLGVVLLLGWWWRRRRPRLTGRLIVEPPEGEPLKIGLSGQRTVRFPRPRDSSSPEVRGRFVVRGSLEHGRIVPVVTYLPGDGPRSRPLPCPEGVVVDVYGILLQYSATTSASLDPGLTRG